MNKLALVTDSTCDLDKETIIKYNIKVLPLRVIYKNEEFLDGINITTKQLYERFEEEIPTTSLPSVQDIEDLFTSLENEGYTHIIAIPISSGLSGTLNGIKLVANNHPNLTTCVFDSKALSLACGVLLEECGKLMQAGKSFEEIVDLLPSIKDRVSVYFVVETLDYLKRGGRIGKISGTIGELLNIKPIISIDQEDGKYYTYAKVRGRKQSINKLVDVAREAVANTKAKIFIMHANVLEEAQKLYDTLVQIPNVISVSLAELGPVMVVHAGPGLLAIAIVKDS